MRMETLENWEAEWSVGEPTSCCFVDDISYIGGMSAEEMRSGSQVNDQLLLLAVAGGGHHETSSSSSMADYGSGRVTAAPLETNSNSADSASLCQLLPHWRAISAADQQPTCGKRKRDPDPDLVAENLAALIGSGSENPAAAPHTSDIKVTTTNNNNRTISFKQQDEEDPEDAGEADAEAIQQMKEMIYRAAAFRPVNLGVETAEKPRRKNVRISTDPQTVAARQRRERISERLRVLQKLVPGGSKMDTASMLDEAANYLKFLRSQVNALEAMPLPITTATTNAISPSSNGVLPPVTFNFSNSSFPYYFSKLQSRPVGSGPPSFNNSNHLFIQQQHYAKSS